MGGERATRDLHDSPPTASGAVSQSEDSLRHQPTKCTTLWRMLEEGDQIHQDCPANHPWCTDHLRLGAEDCPNRNRRDFELQALGICVVGHSDPDPITPKVAKDGDTARF